MAKLDIRSRRRLKEKLEEHQEELLRTMRSGFEERVLVRYGPLNENLDQVVQSIRHQFSDKIFYLGPLRAEPRLVYPVTSNPDRADAV